MRNIFLLVTGKEWREASYIVIQLSEVRYYPITWNLPRTLGVVPVLMDPPPIGCVFYLRYCLSGMTG